MLPPRSRRPRFWAPSLLTGLLLLSHAAVAAPICSAPQDSDRGSLQDLLRRQRDQAAAKAAGLAEPIAKIIATVEGLEPRNRERELRRQRKALIALGPAAAPLLVEHLEPKDESAGAKLRRSELVADALVALESPAITDDLLAAMVQGTTTHRAMVLKVLAASPEPDRVAPAVRDLYQGSKGALRRSALECLSRLGGEEASRLVNEALQEDDVELAGVALEALASTRNVPAAARVLDLVRSSRGMALVVPILSYFRAVPEALDDDDAVEDLIDLAVRQGPSTNDRIRIFDHLREREDLDLTRASRKQAEEVADGARVDLGEAALAMLARHGDRRARKKLLSTYDDRVERQPDWPSSYAERGDIYERIGEWSDAAADYRQAIRFARSGRRDSDVHRGARCLARLKKFKDAAQYLRESGLTFDERRALASDPAFRAMLESKYAEVFRLDDDD